MSTATVGRIVLAVVPRNGNDGQDHHPAVITRVYRDGRVRLHLFGIGDQDQAELFPDRAAAEARCDEHYRDLPGHREDDGGRHIPGTNPRTGEEWHRSDVAAWHAIAFELETPPEPETDDDRAARVNAERAARRAELQAELDELDA